MQVMEAPVASRTSEFAHLEWQLDAVGVLGTGVPRLACMRPAAWLKQRPSTARLHQPKLKTLARGQASRGGQRRASSGTASPGRLARRWRDQGRSTSRGTHDASHEDRDQAGSRRASACVVSLFPLWCKGGKHMSRPICNPIQKELEGPTKDRPAY